MGSGINFDDLPMSSVVYVGRGSFRMEAVAVEGVQQDEPGTPQPIAITAGMVTAPLHASTQPRNERAQDRSEARDSGHGVHALFSSQLSIPRLAAPTGSASLHAPPLISRAVLATLGALVLLCGVVVGTAARHLFASAAPLSSIPAPTPAPGSLANAPSLQAAPPVPAAVIPAPAVMPAPAVIPPPAVMPLPAVMPARAVIAAPAPLKAHVRAPVKPATAPARKGALAAVQPPTNDAPATVQPPTNDAPVKDVPGKAWVDPWAN